MRKVKIGLLLVAFCAASVSAQVKVTAPKVEVTAPKATAPAVPAVEAPSAPAAPSVPAAPAVAAPAAPAAPSVPVAPVAPVVPTVAAPTVPTTPEVAAPTVPEVPNPDIAIDSAKVAEIATEPAPQAEPQPAPMVLPPITTESEPSNIHFHFGTRFGLGASAMRGHIPVELANDGIHKSKALVLWPALSFGVGLAFAVEFNSLFTLAPELQYTLYRANRDALVDNGEKFKDLHEGGVSLYSFELPILARFSFAYGLVYLEVGPQVGYNYYAKIYRDSEIQVPKINVFAFGPSAGFGLNLSETTLIGVRGHFGLLEYGKNTKGYPWTAQVSVTQFFF